MCFYDGAIQQHVPYHDSEVRAASLKSTTLTDVIKFDFVRENAQYDQWADLRSCPEGRASECAIPLPARWETCCSPRCVWR